jgi:rubrerythrin
MVEACDGATTILAAALEKEEKGREFYEKAASTCTNELCKEMFRSLMADESVHMTRIKRIYSSLSGGSAWSEEWKACKIENEDLPKLLRQRASKLTSTVKPATGDLEAVEIGIGMEQSSIEFYSEHQKRATDAFEKAFTVQMLSEERGHLRALEDIKLFLTDPDSWYTEMEHHGLDGA